jgi:acetyl-CoA carboxylase carboxyl transferase subunit alpha
VPEPEGGAHTDHAKTCENLDKVLAANLAELRKLDTAQLLDSRYVKFRKMAQFFAEE